MNDAAFLGACGLAEGSREAPIALAVRRGIANIGCIDPLFIFPTDRFPEDLEMLPLWDSMDFVELACEIEEELGAELPAEFGPVANLNKFTVREFVLGSCRMISAPKET